MSQHGVSHIETGNRYQLSYQFFSDAIGSYDMEILQRMWAKLRLRDIMMDAVAETGKASDVVGEDVKPDQLRQSGKQ